MLEDDDLIEGTAPEEEATEDDDKSGGGYRIPEKTWLEIEEAYALGLKQMPQLSKEYGVSRQSMSKRFKKREITHAMRAHQARAAAGAAVVAAVAKKASEFAERRADMVEETRLDGYKKIQIASNLATKLISDTRAASLSLATIEDDLKQIERWQRIVIVGTRARLKDILNADAVIDEATLPTLVLDDITQKEIDTIQRGDEDNDDEIVDPDVELEALV